MSLEHCPFMALKLAHVVVKIHREVFTVRWWLRDGIMGLPQLFVDAATGQGLFEGDPKHCD